VRCSINNLEVIMRKSIHHWLAVFALALCFGCGSDKPPYVPANTGQSCSTASQCYAGIGDAQALHGEPICMAQFTNGYCTHHCATDADCCAVTGECPVGIVEVCGPFESTGEMYCFLSCEDAAVSNAGMSDANAYCARYANPDFLCRSTGGGSANRKVCVPNG
jgi:hypothetical protein